MGQLFGADGDLFRRVRVEGDASAREELVRRNLPLARNLAGRYIRTQEPFEDLYQVACLGLVNAIDRFDPERGMAFASFAVPTILGQLKRHFRDKGWAVHLPRGLQELALKVQAAEVKLESDLGRSPTVNELAECLECDGEAVLEALDALAARRPASLDALLEASPDDGSGTRHDVVGADDEGYDLVDMQTSVATAVEHLSQQDRSILSLRLQGLTQREIAHRFGVSQMHVSRTLRRIRVAMAVELGLAPDLAGSRRDVRISR